MSDPGETTDVRAVSTTLQRRQARWQAAETPLTRLSLDEAVRHLGGALEEGESLDGMEATAATLHTASRQRLRAMAAGPSYPEQFDWRNVGGKNFVTSVKFQGACGTCTCFSSVAALESLVCITTQTPPTVTDGVEYPDLSEAQLFYCVAASQGRNCTSGWFLPAAMAALQSPGVAPNSYFPYTSGDQPCAIEAGWESVVTTATGSTKLATPDDARQWIATKGPIACMLVVYQDFLAYKSGVYHQVTGQRLGAHSMAVVGYDQQQEAWLCKNSWSTQWGEDGYVWVAYGQVGIESAMHGINGLALIEGKPVGGG